MDFKISDRLWCYHVAIAPTSANIFFFINFLKHNHHSHNNIFIFPGQIAKVLKYKITQNRNL